MSYIRHLFTTPKIQLTILYELVLYGSFMMLVLVVYGIILYKFR